MTGAVGVSLRWGSCSGGVEVCGAVCKGVWGVSQRCARRARAVHALQGCEEGSSPRCLWGAVAAVALEHPGGARGTAEVSPCPQGLWLCLLLCGLRDEPEIDAVGRKGALGEGLLSCQPWVLPCSLISRQVSTAIPGMALQGWMGGAASLPIPRQHRGAALPQQSGVDRGHQSHAAFLFPAQSIHSLFGPGISCCRRGGALPFSLVFFSQADIPGQFGSYQKIHEVFAFSERQWK